MWEAATAIFAVCVRNARSGGYRGLGKMIHYSSRLLILSFERGGDHGSLFMTLTPGNGLSSNISELAEA